MNNECISNSANKMHQLINESHRENRRGIRHSERASFQAATHSLGHKAYVLKKHRSQIYETDTVTEEQGPKVR
jgi:hypothetical protein